MTASPVKIGVVGLGTIEVATLWSSRRQGELDSTKLREVMTHPAEHATPPAA